ncbi:hypothetical protein FQZ97_1024540 [compost metagenome]
MKQVPLFSTNDFERFKKCIKTNVFAPKNIALPISTVLHSRNMSGHYIVNKSIIGNGFTTSGNETPGTFQVAVNHFTNSITIRYRSVAIHT